VTASKRMASKTSVSFVISMLSVIAAPFQITAWQSGSLAIRQWSTRDHYG
jgi:hypothetical protein